MFTGLIERVGTISRIQPLSSGKKILVEPGKDFQTALGDSVAVDGACFTVASKSGNSFWVGLSKESLSRTTFQSRKVGERVNLERALKLSDRLGGHFVLGHIDGVGKIKKLSRAGEFQEWELEAPEDLKRYLVEKGAIAIDGISLTINRVSGRVFSVMLIPETLKRTALGGKKVGDPVNLEADLRGKYVEKFLGKGRGALSLERLKEEGF